MKSSLALLSLIMSLESWLYRCEMIHPGLSCSSHYFHYFFTHITTFSLRFYLPLNIISTIVFNRRRLLEDPGKTGTRNVPIAKEDYEQLMIWKSKKQAQTRVFPKSFRTRLSVILLETCRRVRVKPFVFYGLRRLRVDTLQRMGVETAVYERIMGHSLGIGKDVYRTLKASDLQIISCL